MYSNCCILFGQLLYSSFYTKMIISKSPIIIKYWRNAANYEIFICFYLLKLPVCGFEGPKNNTIDVEYEIQHSHIAKFVSPWSFMRVNAGFLQINLYTKPTLRIKLQTKFQYSSTLKGRGYGKFILSLLCKYLVWVV